MFCGPGAFALPISCLQVVVDVGDAVVMAFALFTRADRAVSLQLVYEYWGLSVREAGRCPEGLGTGGGQLRGQKLCPQPPLIAFGFLTGRIPARNGQAGNKWAGQDKRLTTQRIACTLYRNSRSLVCTQVSEIRSRHPGSSIRSLSSKIQT